MGPRRGQPGVALLFVIAVAALPAPAQSPAASSSSSKPHVSQKARRMEHASDAPLDAGTAKDGVYHNLIFGFSCKVPAGWVQRMEEMNGTDDTPAAGQADRGVEPAGSASALAEKSRAALDRTAGGGCPHTGCGQVLLAAFSRPPEARGEDVNASIVIAAESAATYPGLKDAAQYFGPLTEVIQARGFKVVEEPYEFSVGTKRLPRSDFQKDVGTHVMRQSTLVMLDRGYVVSFTFIAGAQDDVEELVEGLSFGAGGKALP